MSTPKPQDVGILGMDIYFPRTVVSQESLEKYDGVSAGKYTIGLGQTNMAFVGDREDINSIALTVVNSIVNKYGIPLTAFGRVEVGTETIIDKSKSVKSVLMQLFEKAGNTSVDGIDTINACYGGTSALHNSVQWIQSDFWDGRLALVIAGDIAIYEPGPARPTGGVGILAMIVGPNAPIVIESGLKGVHMEHVYDFYKPDLNSEYPVVDGKLSISCYLRAVDRCYQRYAEQYKKKTGKEWRLTDADYTIFHSPYNKLVVKSYARMLYSDFLKEPENPKFQTLQVFKGLKEEDTWFNTDLEKALVALTKDDYNKRVAPSTTLAKQLGNIYCGSLYGGLLSLISDEYKNLVGKRVFMFSYGSGLAASAFSFVVKKDVQFIAEKSDVANRLKQRVFVEPQQFVDTLKLRETRHNKKDYSPSDPVSNLFPNTYYLESVDSQARRKYALRQYHTFASASAAHFSSQRQLSSVKSLNFSMRNLALRGISGALFLLKKF